MYKRLTAAILAFIMLGSIAVSAKEITSFSYRGYQYNSDNSSTAAPAGYVAEKIIEGENLHLETPLGENLRFVGDESDVELSKMFFIDRNRIVSTDTDLNILSIYENFADSNGNGINIEGACGVANDKDNGNLYIADPTNGRLLITDMSGRLKKEINASSVMKQVFRPMQVIYFDNMIYVLDSSASGGYFTASPDGSDIQYKPAAGSVITALYLDSLSGIIYALSSTGKILNLTNGTAVNCAAAVGADKFAYSGADDIFYVAASNRISEISKDGEILGSSEISSPLSGLSFSNQKEQLIVKTGSDTRVSFYDGLDKFIEEKSNLKFLLKDPTDILYDNSDTVYIMDSGNGRILALDSNLSCVKKVYSQFVTSEGELLDIIGSEGIFVKNNMIYIADTLHYRVVISDMCGRVISQITKPEQLEKSIEVPFRAIKVIIDREDNMYVLSDSINMGALVFDSNRKYKSFFGSNNVTTTSEVLLNYIRKKFLTKEQTRSLKKFTPISLANFDMDSNGFLYTVTSSNQSSVQSNFSQMLRKLNYTGDNVFNTDYGELSFGDLEWDRQYTVTNTSFIDVDIDQNGFIFTLDSARGKVFQYSADGQFMSVFAGLGNQIGLFVNPKAIETVSNKVYALDGTSGNITVYKQTEYGSLLGKATLSLNSNRPDESIELWQEVLRLDTNNEYAYYGLGIAYEAKGDYQNAMKNFRTADSRSEYSKALREYRKTYARDNLWWILLVIIAIIAVVAVGQKQVKSRMVAIHGTAYSPLETKGGLPIYVLFHPVDGFSQFRERNLQSVPISIGIVAAFFFAKVFQFFCSGFAFNTNKPVNYNLLSSLAGTVFVFILFVIAVWAISTFLDGKGRLKEIIAVTAYSMTPYLASIIVNVLLSNVLTLQESAFISIVSAIGIIWSGILLLMGMYTIQEYSFMKTVVSVILSIVGMIVITLVVMLFFSLMQQATSYLYSIFYELKLR